MVRVDVDSERAQAPSDMKSTPAWVVSNCPVPGGLRSDGQPTMGTEPWLAA